MSNKVKIGDLDFELPFKADTYCHVRDNKSEAVAGCCCEFFVDASRNTTKQLTRTIADALNNHFAQGDLFHPQLETVIHFAFRYAIDRKTGAVSHMAKYLVQNWHRITPQTQKQIHDEIERKTRMSGDDWKANELPFWAKILDLEISK